jgi:hypothetical protein
MATYVNDLRLKEITTGDESGTWGTSTNTNLELIAEAFSYGTEVITTNADTHTTTIADGSTDPGRSLYLKYTGTLDSACTITIGPNTVSKVWIIENGTSGSQNIIISQGSGANITIPAGDTKVVYSDGAGAGAAFFDAFASLSVVDLKVQDDLTVTDDASIGGDATITGTLGVTGNITGTLATAAQPNITSLGTITSLVATSADINGGTIDSSVIGGTTAAAGTFTTFTSTGIDDNATSTAITIDSSQNVMVGTTDTFVADNSSGNGLSYRASAGDLSVAASNTPAFYANRMGSDATIADFRKDGASVGSIGTIAGYMTAGTSDTGVLFHSGEDNFQPWNVSTNAGRDAAIDLGVGGARFKDLYLSGGVYLGGTGAANLLDDYEEGTWTLVVEDDNGNDCGLSDQTGHYTKIGNLVYVIFAFAINSRSGVGNAIQISGLPFVVENVTYGGGEPSGGLITYAYPLASTDFNGLIVTRANNGSSLIELKYTPGGAQTGVGISSLNASDMTDSTYMTGHCLYRTSS